MFLNNDEIRQDNDSMYGENIDININNTNMNENMNTFNNATMNNPQSINYGTVQGPIIEPSRERIIQRNIVHEVQQVCQFMQQWCRILLTYL